MSVASTEKLSQAFTFIQMNFWNGRTYYPIENFLNREKPDLFSAQEMLSSELEVAPRFYTAEKLITNNHFDYFVLGLNRLWMTMNGHDFKEQVAIFAKKEITCEFENAVLLYKDPDDNSEKEIGDANNHCLLHAKFRFPDGAFVHILNHHGRLVKGEIGRMQSPVSDYNYKMIAEYAVKLDGPIILSGDFNLLKEGSSLQPLKDIGLVNLNDVHNVTTARNEFSWRTNEAVSHLFINDQVIPSEYRIPTDNVSDHLPLVMKFQVKHS